MHVDEVNDARPELEARGVEFVTETIDSGFCRQAYFADPDGNALGIHSFRRAPLARPQTLAVRARTPGTIILA